MNIFEGIIFLAGMIVLVFVYWNRLNVAEDDYGRRWLITWTVKGLVLPLLLWLLLNIGPRPVMPALIPMFPPDKANWFGHLLFGIVYLAVQTGPALYAIGSYWAALTLGWLFLVAVRHVELEKQARHTAIVCCCLSLPVVALILYSGGLGALGLAALFLTWPLAHIAIFSKPAAVPVPSYASAVAKMKFGKYREAEHAIIAQLEKCETDFDGWMMLAELYAKQFDDVAEAQRTIFELCDDPKTMPSQVAVALNRLADWQLQLRGDPRAASRTLDQIVLRLPGTLMAREAALRIRQLPANSDEWKERQQPRTIQLSPLSDQLDQRDAGAAPTMTPADALALVNRCTEKLKRDPNDVEVRERLAVTLADQLGEIDLAVEQLDSLIEMPGQSQKKIPEWLALMAAWEIRRATDPEAARNYLRRLIREYPDSVQAFAAQRRLSLLDAETRLSKISATGNHKLAADNAG